MSTNHPPVPSKNALRALRRLAFSSTTILGAVGSACGLATLNYEARRRIQLAERIVATKHTIRSVSNGRGPAHIARMCEAAENGEDFTLDVNKTNKRRRTRHHSTLAFDQWNENEGDLLALQQSLQKLSQRPRPQASGPQQPHLSLLSTAKRNSGNRIPNAYSPHSRSSTIPPLEYRSLSPESYNNFGPYRAAPSNTHTPAPRANSTQTKRNSLSAERILAATQVPLKRDTDGVYARQTRQYMTTPRYDASATELRRSQTQAMVREEEADDEFPNDTVPEQILRDDAPSPATGWMWLDHGKLSFGELSASVVNSDNDFGVMTSNWNAALRPSMEDSSHTKISTLANNEGVFEQWAGLPDFGGLLEDDVADQSGPYDRPLIPEHSSQSAEPDFRYYFTRVHDAGNRSQSVSDLSQEFDHLQTTKADEEAGHQASAFQSRPHCRVVSIKQLQKRVSKALTMAARQLAMFEKTKLKYNEDGFSQAKRKLNMILGEPGLESFASCLQKAALVDHPNNVSKERVEDTVLNAMTRCLDVDTPSRLVDAEVLFYAFYTYFRHFNNYSPCHRLAAHLLKHESTHSRAAYVLFPIRGRRANGSKPPRQLLYRRALNYLSWFGEQSADLDMQIDETWKVLALAKEREVPLHDILIVPTLRALVRSDQRSKAQKLLNDTMSKTDIQITFLSYGVLMRGHAANGDWPSVQRNFEQLHVNGLSRTRPVGFSMLFQDVLEEYLQQKPLNQAYDYIIDATGKFGLIPTSSISSVIITASLRQDRYDLIQDWVEFVRQLFPMVDIGTQTALHAYRVAQVWKERRSSCTAIYDGCRAMAFAAIRDPFTNALRGIALEAVERYLRKRLRAANELWEYPAEVDLRAYFAKMNLHDMMKFVEEFTIKHPRSEALPLRQREQLKAILHQMQATTGLNELFGGEVSRHKFPNPPGLKLRGLRKPVSTRTELEDPAEARLNDRLYSKELPSRSELWSLVSHVYAGRQRRGQPPPHNVLEWIVPHLARVDRMHDALLMLSSIYESPYVQGLNGTPFNDTLFGMWLRLAVELKHGEAIAKGLWALVDSGIDMNTELLILVRVASDKHSTHKPLSDIQRDEYAEEDKYLRSKLARRRWVQSGRPEDEEKPRFAKWATWEERMRTQVMK